MNRGAYSFSFSFLMHAVILVACLYLLPALDLQPKPLVIDFSLIPSSGPPKKYSTHPKQEKDIQAPSVVQAPPKPKQLAVPKPIKKVLAKPLPKPEIAKKIPARPVERILPKKEEKAVKEERLPEVIDKIVSAAPETFVPEPVMQPKLSSPRPDFPIQTDRSAGASSTGASEQEMEQHYVKAHFVYIKKIIEKNIKYPPMARRMGWQGKVLVSFVVCKDGKVEKLQVIESSGHAQLDKNALETVKKIEPFPGPPVRVKLVLPVMYRIT